MPYIWFEAEEFEALKRVCDVGSTAAAEVLDWHSYDAAIRRILEAQPLEQPPWSEGEPKDVTR